MQLSRFWRYSKSKVWREIVEKKKDKKKKSKSKLPSQEARRI